MTTLPRLARHWALASEQGRGIRIEAAGLDLLNAIGVGELIAAKAAEELRQASSERLRESAERDRTPRERAAAAMDHLNSIIASAPRRKGPGRT